MYQKVSDRGSLASIKSLIFKGLRPGPAALKKLYVQLSRTYK